MQRRYHCTVMQGRPWLDLGSGEHVLIDAQGTSLARWVCVRGFLSYLQYPGVACS